MLSWMHQITLLLSENVRCKLKIVSYRPDVQPVLDHEPNQRKSNRKSKKAKIKLIQTIHLPADSSAVVQVEVRELTGTNLGGTDLMLELDKSWHNILMVDDHLLKRDDSGMAPIIVSNTSLSTQVLKKGKYLGKAATVKLICADIRGYSTATEESKEELPSTEPLIYSNECICWRKQELRKQLQCSSSQCNASDPNHHQLRRWNDCMICWRHTMIYFHWMMGSGERQAL